MFLQKQQANWLQVLAKRSEADQKDILRNCDSVVMEDLHNLIKFVGYDKNLKISPKLKDFLKAHKTFLHNFLKERNQKKKKVKLLRQVKGGFLGVLIPTLISLASAFIL